MKTLTLVLLVLSLAVAIGKLLYAEPGLVTLSYPGWIIETTPVGALVIVLSTVLLSLLLVKLLWLLFSLSTRFRSRGPSSTRAQKRLLRGFIAFTEGRWQQAGKLLGQADKGVATNLISCLAAARSAHFLGDYECRDNYLERVAHSSPQASTAIDLTRAELQIEQQDYPNAMKTLVFLRAAAPRNARAIKLLATVYFEQQNWSKLDTLLPVMRRYKVADEVDIEHIEQACWCGMIQNEAVAGLAKCWRRGVCLGARGTLRRY